METSICSIFTCDTTNINIKYKLPENYVLLVYDEKMSRHFWKIVIVTEVLPSRDSEIKGAIRIKKTNAILKRPHIMTQTKQIRQGNKSEGEKKL